MSKFAHIVNSVVVEVISDDAGPLASRYHPDFVETLVPCANAVSAGWAYSSGKFSAPVEPEIDLSILKSSLIESVNAQAEAARMKYITPGEGQAMTYTEKLAQARAFLAAGSPQDADFPMLANEVGITADNIAGVAEAVTKAYEKWLALGAAIEKVRMGVNKAIADASDAARARQAFSEVSWP